MQMGATKVEKYKILIVEDDIVFAEATKTRLHEMGYLVSDTVTSAEDAIRSVRDAPPDLVLMDIVLNGEMDGIDAASQIRQISDVPILYVSGYVNDEFLHKAKLTFPLGYVCKPFETGALKAAIEVGLYRHGMERTLQEAANENEQLEAQNQQLQKAESLGRMAGAIAHHFNNHLQTVMGNLEMAMDDLSQGECPADILNEAMRATCKAAEISGLMLTYLGQTFGKHELMDMSEACRKSLPLLQVTASKDIVFMTDFPSCGGPAIRANAGQIQQIMTNLINNACDAVSENKGAIALTVKTVYGADILDLKHFPTNWQPKKIAYSCLEVRDEGHGIPNGDIWKIFDPFFTTKSNGRGLGLPVALGIVGTYGGGITVESKPGRGSVFRVFLPVSTEEIPCRPDLPANQGALQAGEAAKTERGATVLLVEDEEQVRNMVRIMLTRLGYMVLEAKDGVEAGEIFQRHQDDIRCVLSDLTMPRMDGWDLLAALRNISSDIPVILSSGYDESRVMIGEHPERPNAFIGKPYRLKALGETIRNVLSQHDDQREGPVLTC
jgi:CheY-like chemotaxis protein